MASGPEPKPGTQPPPRILVAGFGSPILGDDGVALHVVRQLVRAPLPEPVTVAELGTAGLALLEQLTDISSLILVDAILSGAAPGTVVELRGGDINRGLHLGCTHEADLSTAIAFGAALGVSLPSDILLVAIEAEEVTTFSETLSPRVAAAVPEAVMRIRSLCHLGCT
jgi:hydrogenase maturation protease